MKINGLKVERRKLRDLVKADYNPRLISESQLLSLSKSLKDFGVLEPIFSSLYSF